MRVFRSSRLVRLLHIGVLLALIGTAYGFTAGDTVSKSKAGDGTGPISGYTASNVQYQLDSTSPQNVDSVTMTLNATPANGSTMRIRLYPAGPWYACTNSAASLTCATTAPQATAVASTQLTVVVGD